MKHLFILVFITGVLGVSLLTKSPEEVKEFKPKVYPSKKLTSFALGYDSTLSGVMWLQLVQEFDYCENKNTIPKGANRGKNLEEIIHFKYWQPQCRLGWVYQMLNVASTLTPNFKEIYTTGATMLSVVVDDREGATRIYEKGLKLFPQDWKLAYEAGYHHLFEERNVKRAAKLFLAAYKNGGPTYLPSLVSRLYTKAGQALIGKAVLENFLKTNTQGYYTEKAKRRLKEVNAILKKQNSH